VWVGLSLGKWRVLGNVSFEAYAWLGEIRKWKVVEEEGMSFLSEGSRSEYNSCSDWGTPGTNNMELAR